MRCITAICPAGPPKDRRATRDHTLNASPRLTVGWRSGSPAGAVSASAKDDISRSSRPGLLVRDPVMGLVGGIAAPAIEGIVEKHACPKLLQIVAIHSREAKRCGKETRRLWCEVRPRRVRASNDCCKVGQRAVRGEPELLHHHVEGAVVSAMRP